MKTIEIHTDEIRLDQFLKWASLVSSGGEAKMLIVDGMVRLNGDIVTSRGKKVRPGDVLDIEGLEETLKVERAV